MSSRIMTSVLACLIALSFKGTLLGFPNLPSRMPASLVQNKLSGSMQGQSGIVLDLNGDGLEDVLAGAPYAKHKGLNAGALLAYFGTKSGISARPVSLYNGAGNLGWSLASLGDINGDGKDDFAAGAFSGSGKDVSLSGTVAVYHGGASPKMVSLLEGENAMDKFGYALASGDLNGDGVKDLIVGAPFHSPEPALYQRGAVYVYFGPNYDPSTSIRIPATLQNGGIGFSVAAGDISGDGADELLMEASGKVVAYFGSQGSFAPSPAGPDVVFSSTDSGFGRAISVLKDIDGDGYNDIAVGAYMATISDTIDSGRLFILRGGKEKRTVNTNTPSPDLLARIEGEPNCGRFGSAILPLDDMDNDSIQDLAVSAVHADGDPWLMTGKIYLLSGKSLTANTTLEKAQTFAGDAKDMHLGAFMAQLAKGAWLVAGAPTENNNNGRVRIFEIR